MVWRECELAWRRTEFLISQLNYMHSDSDIKEVISILAKNHPVYRSAEEVFRDVGATDPRVLSKFEKFLDFIHCLAYAALVTKAIDLREVDGTAGWYVGAIGESPSLYDYCETNGYGLVTALVNRLHEHVASTGGKPIHGLPRKGAS
jgi:hypothetical protein